MKNVKTAPSWAWLLGVAVFAWMVVFNIRPIQDPDIWWHLASGRYMVFHHTIPHTDVFSLTARGTRWIDTYWLQEILAYRLYSLGDLTAIILAKCLFVALLVFLLGYCAWPRDTPLVTRLWGVLWIFLAAHPRGFGWEEKASLVTLGFLGLLFYNVYKKDWPDSRLIKLWPLFFALWANMHRGFILGLIVFSLFVLQDGIAEPKRRRFLAVLWFGCIVGTLLTPYGVQIYQMGWEDYSLSPVYVSGWAQTPFFHLELFWGTLLIFWAVIIWKATNRQPLGWAFLLTSCGLSAVSMRYASLYPYFIVWAVFTIFESRPWSSLSRSRPLAILGWAMILFLMISFQTRPALGVNNRIFPVKAVQFLEENDLRVPFFHDYKLGGYYLWALDDAPPVLIDGRYPAVQGYQSLYPEMLRAMQGNPAEFRQFLNRFKLKAVMIQYPSTRYLAFPFETYLPRKEWALLYWDDVVLIFVQRLPRFHDLIQKHEFRLIQPDADPVVWRHEIWSSFSPREKSQVRAEIQRNLALHPDSKRAQAWLRWTTS